MKGELGWAAGGPPTGGGSEEPGGCALGSYILSVVPLHGRPHLALLLWEAHPGFSVFRHFRGEERMFAQVAFGVLGLSL